MASEFGSVTGSGTKAVGSIMEAQAQSDALDAAAKIQRDNASLAIQTGAYNAARQQVVAGQRIGAINSGYAASGVKNTSGSVFDVLAMSHANSELDRLNILHGADVRAINFNNQANVDEASASHALKAGYFNAISSIMMGGSTAYGAGAGASQSNMSGYGGEGGLEAGAGDSAAGEEAGSAGSSSEALAFV